MLKRMLNYTTYPPPTHTQSSVILAFNLQCFHLLHSDQLPEGFSKTLLREEAKIKPMFDITLQTMKMEVDDADDVSEMKVCYHICIF